jgi:hypothetical protein
MVMSMVIFEQSWIVMECSMTPIVEELSRSCMQQQDGEDAPSTPQWQDVIVRRTLQ